MYCSLLQRRREECERKARRGEMDPRLEFTFQLLIDGTGLPRSEIMDHVFEGNMVGLGATGFLSDRGGSKTNLLCFRLACGRSWTRSTSCSYPTCGTSCCGSTRRPRTATAARTR